MRRPVIFHRSPAVEELMRRLSGGLGTVFGTGRPVHVGLDDWGADAVVSASQRALALPPGLAFAAVSARFVDRAKSVKHRGTYLDVLRYEEFAGKAQSPTTPAVSLLFALDRQMADIEV